MSLNEDFDETRRQSLNGRRSFTLKREPTELSLGGPINLADTFKNSKPPIVPNVIRSACEEIQERVQTRRLSLLPSPLNALFFHTDALENNLLNSAVIDDVLRALKTEPKGISKVQNYQRTLSCEQFPTSGILLSFFKYLGVIENGISLPLKFPAYGIIIMGPTLNNSDEKVDVIRYTRALEEFLSESCETEPIRRDIICFLMLFLSDLYESINDGYRSEPAICGMTRFTLASRFSQLLFRLNCSLCSTDIGDTNGGCKSCQMISQNLKKPYVVQIVDTMLQLVPVQFWKGTLNSPRSTTMVKRRDPNAAHLDLITTMQKKRGNSKSINPSIHRISGGNMNPIVEKAAAKGEGDDTPVVVHKDKDIAATTPIAKDADSLEGINIENISRNENTVAQDPAKDLGDTIVEVEEKEIKEEDANRPSSHHKFGKVLSKSWEAHVAKSIMLKKSKMKPSLTNEEKKSASSKKESKKEEKKKKKKTKSKSKYKSKKKTKKKKAKKGKKRSKKKNKKSKRITKKRKKSAKKNKKKKKK